MLINGDVRRVVVEFLCMADMHAVRLVSRAWRGAVTEFATFQHSPVHAQVPSSEHWGSSRNVAIDLPRWVNATHDWGSGWDVAAWLSRRAVTKFDQYCDAKASFLDVNARRCIVFVDWAGALPPPRSDRDTCTLRCPLGVDLNAPPASAWLRCYLAHLTGLVALCASDHLRSRPHASSSSPIVPVALVPRLASLTLEGAASQFVRGTYRATCSALFPQLTELQIDGAPASDAGFSLPAMPHLRTLRLVDYSRAFADCGDAGAFDTFIRSCPGLSKLFLRGTFAPMRFHTDEFLSLVAELAQLTELCIEWGPASSQDGRDSARVIAHLANTPASRNLARLHVDGLSEVSAAAIVADGAFPRLVSVNGAPI